jgi:hypothetical protein
MGGNASATGPSAVSMEVIVDGRPLGDTTSLQDETVPPRIAEIVRLHLDR